MHKEGTLDENRNSGFCIIKRLTIKYKTNSCEPYVKFTAFEGHIVDCARGNCQQYFTMIYKSQLALI